MVGTFEPGIASREGGHVYEDVSGTLRANPGDNRITVYGAVEAYGVVAKGNGDAFINPNTHTALSTEGGEPGQGYPCVLEAFGETGIGYWQNGIQTLRAEGENRPSRPSNVVVLMESYEEDDREI